MMNWFERKILGFFVKTKGVFSKPFFAGKGLIFMLHRVLPENERNRYTLNRELAITPEKLESFILSFTSKGYQFISLDNLHDWLQNKKKIKQKFICLTFDDGYRDNFIHALPILKKHNIPATIYITNCLPNGNGILWWYLFEDYVKTANQLIINSTNFSKSFHWKTEQEAFDQFGEIGNLIKVITPTELEQVIMKSFDITKVDFENLCRNLSMSWDEIKQISEEPLITIGAHTMTHLSVKQHDEALVAKEMVDSKKELEKHIGKEVHHFAYPFGGEYDVSKRDVLLAEKIGFKTSTLNQPGNIFKANRNNLQALARMPLGNSTDNERLNYYLSGIQHFSVNGFKKGKYS
jgi:peptidoglycan/xylan/chitin deacetylase (PgdA/CDA1 family)